jgi:carotenoid cleavage dioxygenase-like enzyme
MLRSPATLLAAVGAVVTLTAASFAADEPPPGVEQLLPRGRIAAVFEPSFVPAAEAEIADGAWVLGVVIDGEARAYDLNLLNAHEVVNDRIGEKSFAAVW